LPAKTESHSNQFKNKEITLIEKTQVYLEKPNLAGQPSASRDSTRNLSQG
jgi:hypothetical protein